MLDQTARVWLPIGAAVILTTVVVAGFLTQPDRYELGYEPEQPLEFSHRLHAGDDGIPCEYCHSGAYRSRHAGVPPLDKCMNCHKVTKTDSEAIRTLTAAWEGDERWAWKRIHALPGHVYFDHRPHVRAGIACQECHGRVERMEVVSRELNMRMGTCLNCHRGDRTYYYGPTPEQSGPSNCWACHR